MTDININEMGFSPRTRTILMRNGYTSLLEFESITMGDLTVLRGMGKKTLEETVEVLARHGIEVKA